MRLQYLYTLILVALSSAQPVVPLLGISAANLDTMGDFTLNFYSSSGSPSKITSLANLGGILPQSSIYMPEIQSIAFLSLEENGTELATIISSSGKITSQWKFDNLVLTNTAYDFRTKQFFVCAYIIESGTSFVGELTAKGEFQKTVQIQGIVQVDIATYCPIGHIFFLTNELDDGGNSLVRVDTQNKKVLSNVTVSDAIEILLWDYTDETMYAWVASEQYAGELVVLDINTGKRLSTIVSFENYSANGGTSSINISSKTVSASLLNIVGEANTPVWVVVDIPTKKATVTPTHPSLGFPINLEFMQ